jgi:hypothetical protein
MTLLALAVVLPGPAGALAAASGGAANVRIHQLQLDVKAARAEVRLNGFPLGEATPDSFFSAAVNPYLAGKRNVLEIVLDAPTGEDGKPLPMTGAALEVTVRRFAQGEVAEPGAGEVVTRYVAPAPVLGELASGQRKAPVTLTHPFASEGADFSAELLDAPPLADDAALRDYAMRLRALAEKKDVDALLAEFGPKLRAWAAAYGKPEAVYSASLRGVLARLVEGTPDLAFGRGDLEPRACAGGRVWELRRKGGLPLFRTVPVGDGPVLRLPVFVAPREGKLRVVR